MIKGTVFIFTLLAITLYFVTAANDKNEDEEQQDEEDEYNYKYEDESNINMEAVRIEVKDVIIRLMRIVLNQKATNLKNVVALGTDQCTEFRKLIDWYNEKFRDLLKGIEWTPEFIGNNIPMHAHLENLRQLCGQQVFNKRSRKTLKELLDKDKAGSSNLNTEGFDINEGKEAVEYALDGIMKLVLDNRCYNLQESLAKPCGDLIIELIDAYMTSFWNILNAARIYGERVPMKGQLKDLRTYCLQYHDDPNFERQYEVGTHMEGTSSGPILRRKFSSLFKSFRKSKTFS